MGSSDRMNHFMGAGTCTFSPKIRGLEMVYKDGQDVVYFDGMQDCFSKIMEYLQNDKYQTIGNNGNSKAYAISNSKKVTNFMLETIFEQAYSQAYEWQDLSYPARGKIGMNVQLIDFIIKGDDRGSLIALEENHNVLFDVKEFIIYLGLNQMFVEATMLIKILSNLQFV